MPTTKHLRHTGFTWAWGAHPPTCHEHPLNISCTLSKIISTPSKFDKKYLFWENFLNLASSKSLCTPSKVCAPPQNSWCSKNFHACGKIFLNFAPIFALIFPSNHAPIFENSGLASMVNT